MTQRVIAFSGPIGAGKSTCAAWLAERHGFVPVRFASPLKAMMRAFYGAAGVDDGAIEARIEGELKEVPDPLLLGRSPRHAMQTLGTEWGRDLVAPDLWVTAWSAAAARHPRVVAEDCRFQNEADAVRALGGIVVEVSCLWRPRDHAGHASERGVEPDFVVQNGDRGHPEAMFAKLDFILSAICDDYRN